MDRKKVVQDVFIKHPEVWKKVGVAIIITLFFIIVLQIDINEKYAGVFLNATIMTVVISLIAIVMGFGIGILMGLGRISKNFLLNGISTVYIEILRGTPLLIQIFIIFYGLPSFHIRLDPFVAAALALGLNSGAYQAEIIRGGIQSIPKGQMEAARSSGMTYLQAMRHVILPQGFRLIIPPLTNEYVTVIKDSSLAYTIAVAEITYNENRIIANTGDAFPTLMFVAAIYFTLTFTTSTIMRVVERKFRIPGYMESD
jgi:polar amino acid transport system permease protein